MSNRRQLTGLLLGATFLLAACSSGAAATPASTAAPTTAAAASPAAGVTVASANAGQLGTILTGPDGRTLYTHAGDGMNASTCAGACLAEWPPLTAPAGAKIAAGPGVTGAVASFAGPDGRQWVTYGGMPLYYWQGDAKPGDTTGQGIAGFAVATVAGNATMPAGGASQPASGGGSTY
jgi:predicted lipoprotein with Yx(FWY)xxD motif